MNIDTMRRVDFFLGVPLCFFGTVAKKALSFFSFGKHDSRPRNILFIELSEMGSAIVADPAMRKLKQQLNANLFFVIFCGNSPCLELLNTVPRNNIFTMRDTGLVEIAMDTIRFFLWTRRNHIDTVIDLELFSRFTALLTGFSGASRTIGFHAFYNEGLYRGNFLTHRVAYNSHQHIAKNYIALVNALLSDKAEIPYSKTVIGDEELSLQKTAISVQAQQTMLLKIATVFPYFCPERHKIVLFNTNASDLVPLRRWPQEYFISLAKMVLEQYPLVIILLTGDTLESAEKDLIVKAVNNDRCLNFAGQTSITDLPPLYSISSFMLTNDSGPAHFASITAMPVYVLFGPESPKVYSPLGAMTPLYSNLACSPCVTAANHRRTACKDNVCLQVITPDQVFQTLRPRLDLLK